MTLLLMWRSGDVVGYVEGRCGAVNKCDYCAVQTAHENARMLGLDALEDTRPQVLAIVGTGCPTSDPKPFYAGKREVMRALRDRFGRQVEYVALQEFTTGHGLRSGGLRRPHWNVFIKGIEPEDVDEARAIVRARWCANVPDADPEAQYVEVVRDVGAAAKYVALHFAKRDQAPPKGWSGQRFNASRGYFGELSRREARERARESLRRDRAMFRLRSDGGEDLSADELGQLAENLLAVDARRSWAIKSTTGRRAEALLSLGPLYQGVAVDLERVAPPPSGPRAAEGSLRA